MYLGEEEDPNGLSPHEAGAKLDSGKLLPELVLGGFALALLEVIKVGTYGASKYTPNGWKQVANPVQRYLEAAGRHRIARQTGEWSDAESGLPHLAHEIWNLLAVLQKQQEVTNVEPRGYPEPMAVEERNDSSSLFQELRSQITES